MSNQPAPFRPSIPDDAIKKAAKAKRLYFWALGIASVLVLVNLFSKPTKVQALTPDQEAEISLAQFVGPWQTETTIPISKTLVQNNVTGCGQYAWRTSTSSKNEILVLCSRDGHNWVGYLAWPLINELIGPIRLPNSMPRPHP